MTRKELDTLVDLGLQGTQQLVQKQREALKGLGVKLDALLGR
jgi:ribonuclease PH